MSMMKNNFPNYFMTKDGKRIFYNLNFDPAQSPSKSGSPLIVFNYGLVCSHAHLSKQIPYFDDLGYRILLHDYRGHYNSSGEEDLSSWNFSHLAQDLNDLLIGLRVDKAILIGHSMGVNVSLEFARIAPHIVKGLVLISGTILSPMQTMFDSNIMEYVFPFARSLFSTFPSSFNFLWKISPLIPFFQKSVLEGGFNKEKVTLEFIQIYMNKIRQLSPKAFFEFFSRMGGQDIGPFLLNFKAPVLIIGGEKDKIVPNHFQEVLKENMGHAEFYIVKDGSHVPQMDFPELVNERILSFIRKL